MSGKDSEAGTRNLFQRLNAVMEDIGTVDKTGNNQSQGYRFIEQSVIMAKLRPLFVKHGLALIPEILSTEYRKAEGAKQTTACCAMRFTLINTDNPTERVEALWAAEGADMGDKGVNKAGTSGAKYFLMKLLLLSDKDDPDADVQEEPRRQQQRPAPAAMAGRREPIPMKNPNQADSNGEIKPRPTDPAPADWLAAIQKLNEEYTALTMDGFDIPPAMTRAEARDVKKGIMDAIASARERLAVEARGGAAKAVAGTP